VKEETASTRTGGCGIWEAYVWGRMELTSAYRSLARLGMWNFMKNFGVWPNWMRLKLPYKRNKADDEPFLVNTCSAK
jgi:hypothetical protein